MEKTKQLASQFIQVSPLMIRTVKTEIRAAADGRLTHAQYRILANINRGTNTTVGQIAIDHGVSQPSMSKMVDLLVKKGLIIRSAFSSDRRQIVLRLSSKGLALFTDLRSTAAESLSVKIDQLSKSEQQDLKKSLDHLESLLQKIHKGKI